MNLIGYRGIRLAARNEGKIKSYESCVDVRAWSHDIRTRNCYLRDWIKCDMPICLVPVCTLSSILSIMTCSSRGKSIPRCPSRCQSKVLLDRLCSSCTIMKDCLRNNKEFEKYFREEDVETIHWPCDKCLEIFKNIKVFWRIVIEKILKINIPRCDEFKRVHVCNIRNIAKEWQKEIVEESIIVKSSIQLTNHVDTEKESNWGKSYEINRQGRYSNSYFLNKATETDCQCRTIAIQSDGKWHGRSLRRKISKCTSASIKMVNVDCESHNNRDNDVIMLFKNNIQHLQDEFNAQKKEVDRLKEENVALNVQLQHCRQNHTNNLYHCGQPPKAIDNTMALFPTPFDSKEKLDTLKDIESEMIITLKKCKNENFRHVSVIQVLHKSNELSLSETNDVCFKKDDPINILHKVHETFEAMVNREMSIARAGCNKNFNSKNVLIQSTFRNVDKSRSAPSCSASEKSSTSESNFESANEITIRSGK